MGIFLCLFSIYAFGAYFLFLDRVGLRRLGSPLIGTALTLVVSGLVTVAVVVFDRTLLGHVDAGLKELQASSEGGDPSANSFLHPLAAKRPRVQLAGRMVLALAIGLFATQSIELFVFQKDIQSARQEEEVAEARAELKSARSGQKADQETFDARLSLLASERRSANGEVIGGRKGQHGACAEGTICDNGRKRKAALGREEQDLRNEERSAQASTGTKKIAAIQKVISGLSEHRAQASARDEGVLKDIGALYPYLWRHKIALLLYVAFSLLFIALDLGALSLKYGLARKGEYERECAAEKRERWLRQAEERRLRARATIPTRDEEDRVTSQASEARAAVAALQSDATKMAQRALLTSYQQLNDDREVAESALDRARTDVVELIERPVMITSTAGQIDDPATDPLGRRPFMAGHVDGSVVLSVLGAIGALTALAYLLGGAYMVAQLEQASLPASSLTYVSSRTVLQYGVVITGLSLVVIFGFTGVLLPATRWIVSVRGQGLRSVPQMLGAAIKESGFRTSATRGGGAVLATLAAVAASELTDAGTWGGLEVFGGGAFLGIAGGLALLAVIGFLNSRSMAFRSFMLVLAVGLAMVGAYDAGTKRQFRLPVAEIRMDGGAECREAPFLGDTPNSVYLVDGARRKLDVIPWRTIVSFTLRPTKLPLADETAKRVRCTKLSATTSRATLQWARIRA